MKTIDILAEAIEKGFYGFEFGDGSYNCTGHVETIIFFEPDLISRCVLQDRDGLAVERGMWDYIYFWRETYGRTWALMEDDFYGHH